MDKTALSLSKANLDKRIVLVGSMVPYSILKEEAVFNFALAVGFLKASHSSGIFISMSGLILPFDKIKKDREKGIFYRNIH